MVVIFSFTLNAKIKFQVEVYGGYGSFSPNDLNMYSSHLKKWIPFSYYDRFKYWGKNGWVKDISFSQKGNFAIIKNIFPFGGRLRVHISKNFSISLGVERFSKTSASSPMFNGSYTDNYKKYENLYYERYKLFSGGIYPNLSTHYKHKLIDWNSKAIEFEAYAGLGLVFGKCIVDEKYDEIYIRPDLKQNVTIAHKMEGSGKKIGAHAGLRLNINLSHKIGFFLGGEYFHGGKEEISGETTFEYNMKTEYDGKEENFHYIEKWKGIWFIEEFDWLKDWGEFHYARPENDPDNIDWKSRYFYFDPSGFRFLLGIFYRI